MPGRCRSGQGANERRYLIDIKNEPVTAQSVKTPPNATAASRITVGIGEPLVRDIHAAARAVFIAMLTIMDITIKTWAVIHLTPPSKEDPRVQACWSELTWDKSDTLALTARWPD
jgi:hypothetical protein